ncbi:MAG TPA: MFS transporter [Kineosporiaceae bacterium]
MRSSQDAGAGLGSPRTLDRCGPGAAMTWSMLGFTGGTVAAALAPSVGWLVAARVLQGVCAASLFVLMPVLAARAVGPAWRARAMSVPATWGPVGAAAGPAVGGLIVAPAVTGVRCRRRVPTTDPTLFSTPERYQHVRHHRTGTLRPPTARPARRHRGDGRDQSRRGPDAGGVWLDGHAAIGHRRLSVIDPADGVQPMTDRAERFTGDVLRPTMTPPMRPRLFGRIREHSTVALSGEAADETFGGYPWYHSPEARAAATFSWLLVTGDDAAMPIHPDLAEVLQVPAFRDDTYRDALAAVPHPDGESPTEHRLVEYAYGVPWALHTSDGREKSLLRAVGTGLAPHSVLHGAKNHYPTTHHPDHNRGLQDLARRPWPSDVTTSP